MLRRISFLRCPSVGVSLAEDCIAAGSFHSALEYLSLAKWGKQLSSSSSGAIGHTPLPFVDYLRALCFLRLKDPLKARTALADEVFNHPTNDDARDLLGRVNESLKNNFVLPQAVMESEPLFADICSALQSAQRAGRCPASPSVIQSDTVDVFQQPLSRARLFSLYSHAKEICEQNIAGDFVECGVLSPASSLILAVVAKHMGGPRGRRVVSCDPFAGPSQFIHDAHNATLQRLAAAFDVEIVRVAGPFEQTLPKLQSTGVVGDISLLHLDCDWYDNTKTAISTLYPSVAKGGVVQIDDYNYWDGCKQAICEHFDRNRMSIACLQAVDSDAVWFRKVGPN